MRPLVELADAKLAGLVGLVFDVDDTVTRDGRLEADAFVAMWRLREAGVQLVAVTGRPLGWVDVIARHWPVSFAVGENGAGWVSVRGAKVTEGYFDDEEARRRQRQLLERIEREVAASFDDVRLANDQRARRCDLAFDVGESVRLPASRVEQLVALIEAVGARSSVSSVHAHAIPGEWDKDIGVDHAATALFGSALDRERWLFVGDSGNDAAAFAGFPLSVGVANVMDHLEHLPSAPSFVTEADRGRGFRELADRVLAARA